MSDTVLNTTINELTIKRFIKKPEKGKYQSWNSSKWVLCECSCGKVVSAPLYGVQKGLIKSCGHLRAQLGVENLKESRKTNPTPTAVYLTHNGKTLNISDWSKETGIPRSTIMYRMSKELPVEKILERKEDNNEQSS